MLRQYISSLFIQDNPVNQVNEVRLDMLFKQTQVMGFLSFVLAAILAFLMVDTPRGKGVVAWAGLIGLLFVIRWFFFYRIIFKLRQQGVHRFRLYHGVITFFMLMSGLLWGTGVYLFMPYIDQVELFITFISILVGITAGNIPSFAPSFLGYMCFMVPTLLGGGLKAYYFEYYVLSGVVIIYMGYLALTARRMSKVVIQTIGINIENERLLKQVTIEKDKAEKANIQKSKFLAAASHDLRQPLNSMGLFLYAYSQVLSNKDKNRNIFSKIEQSYEALKELFDALLEVSRLDAGNIELAMEPVAIAPLVQSIVDELAEQAEAKNLTIQYQGANHYVNADKILLSRILRNLLDNALKYTEQGQIKVEEQQQGQRLKLTVSDSGIGIPHKELQNIFDEYHQLSNKRRDRRQGIGLGLAIVKKMANLMDCSIEVTSQVGQGSCFSFSLEQVSPIKKPAITIDNEALHNNIDRNKKILVIDDEPDILQGMVLLLKGWGYQVDSAQSYDQALSIIQQDEPDIILCDYRLQDNMNGIQVLLKLATNMSKPVGAIIISGDTDPQVLEHIKGNGFTCLHKPIDPAQLQAELNHLVIPH
jgi:signal transduction histidine kinase/CheY-like chemotaxis protein